MLDTYAFSSPRRFALRVLLPVAITMLTIASAAHAQIWNEVGDAGDLPVTAQSTVGTGLLASIKGALGSPTDVDMYCIKLPVVPPAGAPLVRLQCVAIHGPNVWLFDAAGNGVYTNESCLSGYKELLAPSTSLPVGTYYVAVSYYGVSPKSAGGSIWQLGPAGQRAPDGPGAGGVVTSWSGVAEIQPINPYQINFTYMEFCESPTPAVGRSWGALKIIYR